MPGCEGNGQSLNEACAGAKPDYRPSVPSGGLSAPGEASRADGPQLSRSASCTEQAQGACQDVEAWSFLLASLTAFLIAAVALALFRRTFRCLAAVGRERTPDVILRLGEPALLAPDIAFAAARSDEFSWHGFLTGSCWNGQVVQTPVGGPQS